MRLSIGLDINKTKVIGDGFVSPYGPELITNGGFDTDSDWVKGSWVISGGVASDSGNGGSILQGSVLEIGVDYKVTVTVTGNPSLLTFPSGNFNGTLIDRTLLNGTNDYIVNSKGTSFAIYNSGPEAVTIDNVSVKEVL